MDFTEYGAERNIVDARDLPKGTENRDESKRLLDDIKAIEAPERQMILRASARQLRPGAFYRGSGDAPAPISNRQFSPPASPSSKQKLLVIFTVAVGIAAGVAIGVVFSAANTVRLALKASEVTHSLARLVGGWSVSVAEGTTPTAAPDAMAEQIPATHSAQIPSAAESGGAPLDQDLRRIEAVLSELVSGQQLAVDANGRFDRATAIAYAKALSDYPLFWYEEPGDPLDYDLQAELASHYESSLATGENLFSMQDARNLIRYGGMRPDRDYLQFDCALSYGLVEYLRTLQMLGDYGWSWRRCIPHGGHQMSLNIAAGLGLGGNESYPDLFQPYGGFPDGVAVENGYITLPDLPGIGFEGKSDLYQKMKEIEG